MKKINMGKRCRQ